MACETPRDYLERQKAIDALLRQDLNKNPPPTSSASKNKSKRLEAKRRSRAVALIQEEIQKTSEDPEHFPELMLEYRR